MFARQRSDDDVEFLQSDDAIRHARLRDMSDEIKEQFDRRIVWQGEYFIEHVPRPVFVQHLLLSNQDDVGARSLALAYEVAALEERREADDVRRM